MLGNLEKKICHSYKNSILKWRKKISQTKIEKDRMETEDHLRKAAESGRAKYNYLKGASNSEMKMFFKLKIPLYFIAST